MCNDTAHYYSNGVEKRTQEQLLVEYRDILFAHEMREHFLAGRRYFPERAVRERLANIEKNDPIGFDGDFKIWADIQGWLPGPGALEATEPGARTLAVDGVHS